MITKTTISAIRALMFVAQSGENGCLPPRRIAEALGESPTYMAKISRLLVRAGILRAEKGVKGGVWLGRAPKEINLLAVVEACQGTVLGDYCIGGCDPEEVCAYHRAAMDLHDAITGVLSRWNLAQLLRKPQGAPSRRGIPCLVRLDGAPSGRR